MMLLLDSSELSDEDEGDKNDENIGDIIVNDVPGCLEDESTASDLLKKRETALKDKTPTELFEQFYFGEVKDLIVKETMRYAADVQQEMAFPNRTKKQQVRKKKNIKSSITKLQNKTEEEIEKLNNVGLLARKNRFLEFRTEIKDILDSIISICEEKDEETYCTEKDDILDTLEEILVAIDTQLMPSVVNSDFEVKNQGSSHSLVSARSAEVKLPTLSLPIFSGVTEEWLAFSDLFEAAVSNNNDLTGAQKLQYLKGSLKSDALKIINSLSITNDNFEIA
ncbi:DUF1758 domain-containing protein [Trichonephila clavipes]|nr:DUF1758 domain-containing protein [Trichonephila clavipes]